MTVDSAVWERARALADAVLYEGYLLYPYRATSAKNLQRWQFGVLGPPGAADAGLGEDPHLTAEFLVRDCTQLRFTVRFLHLQNRRAQRWEDHSWIPVQELVTPTGSWLTWDEAVETEICFGPVDLTAAQTWSQPLAAAPHIEVETVPGGRLIRERHGVHAVVQFESHGRGTGDIERVTLTVRNTGAAASDRQDAIERSLIGAHVLVEALDGGFISLLEPSDDAIAAVADCRQHRCFPVLAGPPGDDRLLLISPIILYDHPQIAEQSSGALYDSTEIDEILTLRVMAMTDEEKAQARATDARAARIIDQCDGMSAEAMLGLHGVWSNPVVGVVVDGVRVVPGSRVRLRPSRPADAQDMFVSGRIARVTAVHEDLDGATHVAVVMDDGAETDVHEWYGRHLYFAPDEIEPLSP